MILTSGCFDGIHAGHVAFLTRLAALQHPIYVAVASDEYIRRTKGREPKYREVDRLHAVKGLSMVSDGCIHGASGVWGLLGGGPGEVWTAFAKGFDWIADRTLAETCKRLSLPLIFIDSGSDLHTSR